jgi:hypothetical protein
VTPTRSSYPMTATPDAASLLKNIPLKDYDFARFWP